MPHTLPQASQRQYSDAFVEGPVLTGPDVRGVLALRTGLDERCLWSRALRCSGMMNSAAEGGGILRGEHCVSTPTVNSTGSDCKEADSLW